MKNLVREVRVVGGEECEVWRWIGDSSRSQTPDDVTDAADQSEASSGRGPDVRQLAPSIYPHLADLQDNDGNTTERWGRGVGEQEAAVCAPTQCLKIRNLAHPDSHTRHTHLTQPQLHTPHSHTHHTHHTQPQLHTHTPHNHTLLSWRSMKAMVSRHTSPSRSLSSGRRRSSLT
ncbi:hypothetical protein FHG87_021563 [Trinorchestia longiramus]|nr:hypothetical protein FHG87_021563 [Trinorchestia longiramus]